MPSAGHVVARDLETVGVDLGPVPLDEVLEFRAAHGDEFQRYARDLRAFTRGLHAVTEVERDRALEDRAAELDETAEALRTIARQAWKRPLAFGLGIVGETWRVVEGDVIGGLLALGAAGIAAASAVGTETSAYSYLFSAGARFRPVEWSLHARQSPPRPAGLEYRPAKRMGHGRQESDSTTRSSSAMYSST
jgi:hypothetical protein